MDIQMMNDYEMIMTFTISEITRMVITKLYLNQRVLAAVDGLAM